MDVTETRSAADSLREVKNIHARLGRLIQEREDMMQRQEAGFAPARDPDALYAELEGNAHALTAYVMLMRSADVIAELQG
jgi:hypothetical protein